MISKKENENPPLSPFSIEDVINNCASQNVTLSAAKGFSTYIERFFASLSASDAFASLSMTTYAVIYDAVSKRGRREFVLLIMFLSLILFGCGYQIAGRGQYIPSEIKSIAIPVFENKTMEPIVEEELTPAVIREFIKDARIRVIDRSQADLILYGSVASYKESPLSFDQNQDVLEYRITVTTHLKLIKRSNPPTPPLEKGGEGGFPDNILWEKDITESAEYGVNSDVMSTKTSKLLAIQEIARNLSEEVTDRVLWGW